MQSIFEALSGKYSGVISGEKCLITEERRESDSGITFDINPLCPAYARFALTTGIKAAAEAYFKRAYSAKDQAAAPLISVSLPPRE